MGWNRADNPFMPEDSGFNVADTGIVQQMISFVENSHTHYCSAGRPQRIMDRINHIENGFPQPLFQSFDGRSSSFVRARPVPETINYGQQGPAIALSYNPGITVYRFTGPRACHYTNASKLH